RVVGVPRVEDEVVRTGGRVAAVRSGASVVREIERVARVEPEPGAPDGRLHVEETVARRIGRDPVHVQRDERAVLRKEGPGYRSDDEQRDGRADHQLEQGEASRGALHRPVSSWLGISLNVETLIWR